MSSPMLARHKVRDLKGRRQTVAVVGATGTIGGRVARALADAGHQVVGLSRSPGREASGRVVAVDLRTAAAAERALDGVDAVYLPPPMAGADPLRDEQAVVRSVITAAARTGVKHVVMHTALRADRGNTGARILDNKTPLEAALRDSGVPRNFPHARRVKPAGQEHAPGAVHDLAALGALLGLVIDLGVYAGGGLRHLISSIGTERRTD